MPTATGVVTCELESGTAFVPTALWGWDLVASGAFVAKIYDGVDTSVEELAVIQATGAGPVIFEYPDPIEVDLGSLYVDYISGASNATGVLLAS